MKISFLFIYGGVSASTSHRNEPDWRKFHRQVPEPNVPDWRKFHRQVPEILTCSGDYAWTEWFNQDTPGSTGDYETLHNFVLAGTVCSSPIGVEAIAFEPGSVENVHIDIKEGFYCKNDEQPGGERCANFKARFCCRQSCPYFERVTNDAVNWHTASKKCFEAGGILPYFENSEEYDLFTRQISIGEADHEWLGIQRSSYKGWITAKLSDNLFFKWRTEPKEPNNFGGNENCVEYSERDFKWNDVNCHDKRKFACRFLRAIC